MVWYSLSGHDKWVPKHDMRVSIEIVQVTPWLLNGMVLVPHHMVIVSLGMVNIPQDIIQAPSDIYVSLDMAKEVEPSTCKWLCLLISNILHPNISNKKKSVGYVLKKLSLFRYKYAYE
jgi:hypothetical protein